MPTIKSIALRAGVSHGTVSNVLNKKGNVSAEKIQLVEQAAKELGYKINVQAQQLRSGTTKKVCIILPGLTIKRYIDFYIGLESELRRYQIDSELICTDQLIYNEKVAYKKALSLNAAAIVVVSSMIIADNICGGDSHYLGSQGSSVIKVFDMTAATTGINETNAKKSGLEVDTVILSPMSHAGYYPGGKVMTMKVVFEKDTYRLLGAQIIGYEGVDKRIDVLATAIHAGLKATQLKDLDLAYAPPYSSAKDPVNMAGFMIDNIAKGTLKQWHLEDMDKISKDKSVVLLDVRTVGEFNRGHMDGFKNIPVDELRERINEIEKGKPVYLICQSGLRSYIASRILEGNGYETYNFSGGFRFYDAVINDRALIERAYACGMDYYSNPLK